MILYQPICYAIYFSPYAAALYTQTEKKLKSVDLFILFLTFVFCIPNSRRVNMAWLFYPPNSQSDLRKDSSIPTSFTRDSLLDFTVAMYDVSGSFLGYTDQWQDKITYCTTSSQEPVQFGVQFKKEVLVISLYRDKCGIVMALAYV